MTKRRPAKRRFRTVRRFLTAHLSWNIGTVIFLSLFIYICISLVIYLTSENITSYQVKAGVLGKNETVQAIAFRHESVIKADTDGYITCFTPDASKIQKGALLCAVGPSEAAPPLKTPGDSELSALKTRMAGSSRDYSSDTFDETYALKYALQSSLYDTSNLDMTTMQPISSPSDGIVVFGVDRLEGLSEEQLRPELFHERDVYHMDYTNTGAIRAGDPLYKLITDQDWALYFPVSSKQQAKLADIKTIKVKFVKDGFSEVGALRIVTAGDRQYAKIALTTGMVRYAKERFLDIELVTNTDTGLKIPRSAVAKKKFFTVPGTFVVQSKDGRTGVNRLVTDKDGKSRTEFVETDIYKRKQDDKTKTELCYIDTAQLAKGDRLQDASTGSDLSVETVAKLSGVYEINKGYAEFREINILDSNEEYCIVEPDTAYGLSQYDFIAQDASSVKEMELTAKK